MFQPLGDIDVPTPTPTPTPIPMPMDDALAALEWENQWQPQCDTDLDVLMEPLREPAADDIPWRELVYWLDEPAQESACCSCCCPLEDDSTSVGHFVFIPQSFYHHLSPKIPMIAVLPRIDGLC